MSSYQDLLSQKAALEKQQAEIEKQITEARRAERAGVIAQIRNLMADHGLTAADLNLGAKSISRGSAKETSGKKVAPKYRNVATGDTWSGRGLQPKWLRAELAAGRSLNDFAI